VVERDLAKVDVAGSTPVSRSIYAPRRGFMTKLPPASHLCFLITITIALFACGDNRSLQSVSITPAVARSKTQFTATGIYNQAPTGVNITNTVAWCVGSSNGICAGNIVPGATVNAGLSLCIMGFTGSVTILAGQSRGVMMPDTGPTLKPFGTAQLTCP
jgi:hypothetical protein